MSSFDLLLQGEDHSDEIVKPLSKKALKKLKRIEKEQIIDVATPENELKKLYENDGIWFTIIEYFNFKELMLVFSLISKRDLNIVDSNWCQSFLLLRGMEQFHTLTPKDCNSIFNSFDHKRYFAKLRQHQKQAKRKKPEIEDTIETYLDRKKTFKRLYQKLWGDNNHRVLTLHQTNQAIRSEIQAEFQRLRAVWTSIKTHQFECFHDEFEIEDSLSEEEKGKFKCSTGNDYRFTCKKCGLVAISNFMPIFTGARSFGIRGRLGSSSQQFKLLNIFH